MQRFSQATKCLSNPVSTTAPQLLKAPSDFGVLYEPQHEITFQSIYLYSTVHITKVNKLNKNPRITRETQNRKTKHFIKKQKRAKKVLLKFLLVQKKLIKRNKKLVHSLKAKLKQRFYDLNLFKSSKAI